MHPPRRKRITEGPRFVDRLADWLLTRCPFSTLAVLGLIVLSPTMGSVDEPLYVAIPVVMADLAVNVIRRVILSGGAAKDPFHSEPSSGPRGPSLRSG